MKRLLPARSFSIGLVLLSLLVACGGGAGPTATPVAPTPSATPAMATPSATPAMATPTPTQLPTPTEMPTAAPTPTPGLNLPVSVTENVAYESSNPVLVPGTLDVYAPSAQGTWPVVVMFHGAPGSDPAADRATLSQHARAVAKLGFVVFNASWGQAPGGSGAERPTYDALMAVQAEAACAVEFARAKATDYGGDPSTMIVFGHSGGGHAAVMATFARPTPSAGCLGGNTLGAINALVTWEGNWLLSTNYPDWNSALAADPRVMDAITPWAYLSQQPNQKVVMLVSEHPGVAFEREVGDPWAADSWLTVRDPSGDLRRQLESNGAFADGILDFIEVQQLLFSVLQAQGNPVSLDTMPDSRHDWLAVAGWPVFLAAFEKAAGRE